MSGPAKATAGQVWAVLSLRNILHIKDVSATSNCSLFTTKDEAIAFARRVSDLKKNWIIHVAPIPILLDHKDALLPEEATPFHEN